jgi:hypothetical protein
MEVEVGASWPECRWLYARGVHVYSVIHTPFARCLILLRSQAVSFIIIMSRLATVNQSWIWDRGSSHRWAIALSICCRCVVSRTVRFCGGGIVTCGLLVHLFVGALHQLLFVVDRLRCGVSQPVGELWSFKTCSFVSRVIGWIFCG